MERAGSGLSWRNAQVLVPDLTFNPQFRVDPRRQLELQPLRPAVRRWHLEFNRKIGPRHRARDKFGVCEGACRGIRTENSPP